MRSTRSIRVVLVAVVLIAGEYFALGDADIVAKAAEVAAAAADSSAEAKEDSDRGGSDHGAQTIPTSENLIAARFRVKNLMRKALRDYIAFAWPHDDLLPRSCTGSNSLGGVVCSCARSQPVGCTVCTEFRVGNLAHLANWLVAQVIEPARCYFRIPGN